MKKTVLTIILSVLAVFACVFAFVACGEKVESKPTSGSDENGEVNSNHTHAFVVKSTDAKFLKFTATCTQKAVYYYSCKCGEKGDEYFEHGEINPDVHTEVVDETVAPTCTQTGLTEGKHCSVCSTIIIAQSTVPTVEHNYVDWQCVVCNAIDSNAPVTEGLEFVEISNWNTLPVYSVAYSVKKGTATNNAFIKIPSTYNDKPIISIGEDAFKDCSSLKRIEIPNSVTDIECRAFRGCSGLTSIEIPNSVTSIGAEAFRGCSSLTSIEIPNSVTSIDDEVFRGCSSLTSIIVQTGNAKYHSNGNCLIETKSKTLITGCQNSVIPTDGSVTSIGDYAFRDCGSLTSIEIPNSVMSIGYSAFYNCRGLTSIEIPNSVTSIGGYAFSSCSSLIQIDSGVQYVDNWVLGCDSYSPITTVTLRSDAVGIIDYAFYYCSKLTSIKIPNSVTSIGDKAFDHCSSLTSIEIPNSVMDIGVYTFYGCSGLTSLKIGSGVTSIGNWTFAYCSSLTSIEIPNSVTSIGDEAFYGCSSLTSIEISDSVTYIGGGAFCDCGSLTNISFNGTKMQWKAISNGYVWNENTGDYTVTCTDGTLSKRESE
ncbi:MAG: leucine-rich repeat domain-containing protein [Clostridiales bacterium]|nr:leucine-rich repeat domain-containing protein [Clostridiales bacterium]